ncbi:2-oxoglutarate and iron-dependent oxygenase domain-containing protein 3-like protein [Dinothrombium tinctorium]|uniref:2-oxoglutarate and iron-dependent oxygenase domain-containing protein 3-like protein n=1 Tax=Dinothrombium tinctorium TaxID=1965070 RepID=A0A443RI71_9ACAR|nr:2-oxoglutarate and iron-dependent oxygenase domain-containing protein 3-like protein [Dinothrombium tinctorium]
MRSKAKSIDKNGNKSLFDAKRRKKNEDDCRNEWQINAFKRLFVLFIALFIVYFSNKYTSQRLIVFASGKESIRELIRRQRVECSKIDYDSEREKFGDCIPRTCARLVTDSIVSEEDAKHLLTIAKKGMAIGGSSGSATILDLHSGALSYEQSFINIYKLMQINSNYSVFSDLDFQVYERVKNKIHSTIASQFNLNPETLFLTHPTFFSRLTAHEPNTVHDEYWHLHVDKHTYRSFHYTSILYLSTYNEDFEGGRFVFVDQNQNVTIEPRTARVLAFTSGSENTHYVERVTKGTRYALTVSFTCDAQQAIQTSLFGKNTE